MLTLFDIRFSAYPVVSFVQIRGSPKMAHNGSGIAEGQVFEKQMFN